MLRIASVIPSIAFLTVLVVSNWLAADAPRPNILYFYVDDMGWGSIGPNGQSARRASGLPNVQTPNIDRLAAEGLNFTRGYGCHVCSPARSSQQTGFHQGHTFADRNDPDNAKKAIRSDDVAMGDALRAAGYATGYWGKWGYGGSQDLDNPVILNVQTLPTSHGYDNVLAELHHVRAHTFFQPTLWRAPAAPGAMGGLELAPNSMAVYRGNSAFPAEPAHQNHEDYPAVGYCDDAYAFAALQFVREKGAAYNATGQPFFGLLAVQIPHAPFAEISTLPEWDRAYADDPHFQTLDPQTRQWAAMVTRIDAHFGNILAALDDPNQDGDTSDSIADNTLVVFQSDNGGPNGRNKIQLDANGGLRGVKGEIFEGGIRVPLVMRWPDCVTATSLLKAGSDIKEPVDVTDLMPTFCELAGVPAPLGADGVSIAPWLIGSSSLGAVDEPRASQLLSGSVNSRDELFKRRRREYLIHEAGNGTSIIRGVYKLIRSNRGELSLYDLETDPAEQRDLSREFPDMVEQLENRLLGERVLEPRGFATTYHYWEGADGADMADASNWSDYRYENAGKTYLFDGGAPRLSWIAHAENRTVRSSVAHATGDLEFLALELRGSLPNGSQTLVVGPEATLLGRNEIRLAALSELRLDGGTVASMRWLDIAADAKLLGFGTIDCTVFNGGSLASTEVSSSLAVLKDYWQLPQGELRVALHETPSSPIRISGTASLSGYLQIEREKERTLQTGDEFLVLNAGKIVGRFDNEADQVVDSQGNRFAIRYSPAAVSLVAE